MARIYQINEVFHSVQGEGIHAGKMATFIRLQGCTVGCPWCDTKYTWKKGGTPFLAPLLVDSIHQRLLPHVVITGGEPTLWDLDELILELRAEIGSSSFIQMETSGQNNLKGAEVPDWVTWSPKRNLQFTCAPELRQYVSEIKIVVDAAMTLDDVRRIVEEFPREVPVILMPEGSPPKTENINKTLDWLFTEPKFRFGDRLQYRIGVK